MLSTWCQFQTYKLNYHVHSCYDINRNYITLTSGPMAHAISWKILFLRKILLKDNPIMANKNLPAWVQNLMCFTPTVIMWSGTAGFHCSMKILSLCPLVSASLAPFRQSQTTMQWSSSSPTDASFLPSPSNKNNNWLKLKREGGNSFKTNSILVEYENLLDIITVTIFKFVKPY